MPSDQTKPFVTLAELTKERATAAGLELNEFMVIPGLDGAPDRVRMVLLDDPEQEPAPEKSEDEIAVEQMMAATAAAEEEERARKAREGLTELQQKLRNPREGIL